MRLIICLNAPFGAQCFPTEAAIRFAEGSGLNAPFGAQCFPTEAAIRFAEGSGLNAPFGAQCFPTSLSNSLTGTCRVSMHLLVLSAFRHREPTLTSKKSMSQCTFWCSVLSDSGK